MRRSGSIRFTIAALLVLFGAAPALAGGVSAQVGLDALIARVGLGNQPTGAGVAVGQAEADEPGGTPFNVYPDPTNGAFAGKSFTEMSGDLDNSMHATDVGSNFYGLNSIAPGITSIFVYEAGNWAQSGHLRTNSGGAQPLPPPPGVKIFNNSWVGSFGGFTNECLRRADLIVDRDDVLIISGVSQPPLPAPNPPLMSHTYNGIAVGRSDGGHHSGPTDSSWDGPGRMKPEIVAPGGFTSFSTPVVGAAAALMIETARGLPLPELPNPNGERSETIKAVLLAGANHRPGWTNNPVTSGPTRGVTTTPLDPVSGVDVVNVNNSHLIMTGLEQNGAIAPPSSPNIQAAGWDLASVPSGSRWYRFRMNGVADAVSILATWHRVVPTNFSFGTVANFDLHLLRVTATGLQPLVGDAGVPIFASGNVVSQSAVDNVEHLFVRNLQPGQYVIELRRVDTQGGAGEVALAWLMPDITHPADINGDGSVDVNDLLVLIGSWGVCSGCPADINDDGFVDVNDLLILIGGWG